MLAPCICMRLSPSFIPPICSRRVRTDYGASKHFFFFFFFSQEEGGAETAEERGLLSHGLNCRNLSIAQLLLPHHKIITPRERKFVKALPVCALNVRAAMRIDAGAATSQLSLSPRCLSVTFGWRPSINLL